MWLVSCMMRSIQKYTSCASRKCTVDWTTRKDPGPSNIRRDLVSGNDMQLVVAKQSTNETQHQDDRDCYPH